MAKIKAESCSLEGFMIDGYAPKLEKLQDIKRIKKMQNKGLISDYKKIRTKFTRYFYADGLTENQHLLFFKGLISELVINFCPYIKRFNETACNSMEYTLGKKTDSLTELISYNQRRRWGFYLPFLQREYDNDQTKNKYHYIQFVNIYSKTVAQNCGKIKECYYNWSRNLGFIQKRKKEYVDYGAFRHIWSDILRDLIIAVREYGSLIDVSTGQNVQKCNFSSFSQNK